ncbi:glycosyltransferase family 2 protein [Idiomarina abyssalis]|uniref:glycosyltransferase family 2 protein n=1 Tax=Idiomarina abyssalis TaxID=86102 RepID=UPI003A91BCAB
MVNILSVVVCLYNEELVIPSFWNSFSKSISKLKNVDKVELIWVNDGSVDNTQKEINSIIDLNQNQGKIKHTSIEFSKNYGHESAMIAGVDNATGDAIICMDCDLQHPPEKIESMVEKYLNDFDIVLAYRKDREDNSFVKNKLSGLFYNFLNSVSSFKFNKNSSDFFLISKQVQQILINNFRERNRFLRGYIQIVGFNLTYIEYKAPKRAAGESNYSFKKLLKLSFDAIFSFSNKPLLLASYISISFLFFTASMGVYSLINYFIGDKPPSGYTTLILFNSICFSLLFLILAILSIYFSKVIGEIRERPIYLIKNIVKK